MPVDVDDVAGAGQPELHQRDQALAARQDLRLVAEPAQERHGVLESGRTVILEGRRNHARLPAREGKPGATLIAARY